MGKEKMRVSDFDYELPPSLIAQEPLARRDQSRLMVVERKTGKFFHTHFSEFVEFLSPGDVLVLNNAKVIPGKIWGEKEGKKIEFLLLREIEKGVWEALSRPAKRIKTGDTIYFDSNLKGKIIKTGGEGIRVISFSSPDLLPFLKEKGFAPLPPYIKRDRENQKMREVDLKRYQTVYAQKEGAIAAPTAGLHFTPELLESIEKKGVLITLITLDIGLATFQPIRSEYVEKHKILPETYMIEEKAAERINRAKKEAKPIVAVGTTCVRTLESAFAENKIVPGKKTTELFIYPGYEFKVIDRLLTNFHLPRSTLLMLVAAFAGLELIKEAYREAIERKYRFYSYGDCMFII